MKRYFLFTVVMILIDSLSAQEKQDVKQFVKRYSERGISATGQDQMQIGQPMPDFYFDNNLNSKALKGKCIVLDFWATWCTGCLYLSRELDSLMLRGNDVYRNVQIIGVNTKEKLADKGYNAREYWKKTGKGFPMVDGAAADSCGASVKNGFPTIMLVDDQGIIRGRWDAWTPTTANAVMVASWEYAVYPGLKKMTANIENAKALMAKKDWVSALYFLESIPETDAGSLLKLKAMLHVSEDRASSYAAGLKLKFDSSNNFAGQNGLLTEIVLSGTQHASLVQTGLTICNLLKRKPEFANTSDYWANYALLRLRFAESEKLASLRLLEQAINMSKDKKEVVHAREQLLQIKEAYSK